MFRFLLVVSVVVLAGCGVTSAGVDAGSPVDAGVVADAGADAGAVVDAGEAADAGAPADAGKNCAVKEDCPCFANDDCPAAYACTSFDATGTMVYCVPGARGTGPAGVACTKESDCQSALCVDIADGGMACSKLCSQNAECPNPPFTRCLYVGFGINASLCAR